MINHNPLPDITHEEFINVIGPLLAPENYLPVGGSPSSPPLPTSGSPSFPPSPAPFDWLHFEGRSVKTTLSNVVGVDGLARERRWRSHCVFSVDVGRKGRQGVEAVWIDLSYLFSLSDLKFPRTITAPASCRRDILEQVLRSGPFTRLC